MLSSFLIKPDYFVLKIKPNGHYAVFKHVSEYVSLWQLLRIQYVNIHYTIYITI